MFPWLAGIPPARAFMGHSGHGQLLNRCHLCRVERSGEGTGRGEGCVLFARITQSQKRHVWIAVECVVHTLLHRQMRQEWPLPCSRVQTTWPLLQRLVVARRITEQLTGPKCL